VETLIPREVPLGGVRAMTVRRTLPQRQRTLIGAWCFVDHYGPDPVDPQTGMVVPPHPHTGLQTVSWLFSGEIEHRDSAGHRALVRPGEVNLMTAGRGISHSEYSTPGTTTLHGAQLWLALPAAHSQVDPAFEHYAPPLLVGEGWVGQVFLGSLLGHVSPVQTYSPLVGAEIRIEAGTTLRMAVDPSYEHGILLDSGALRVDGKPLERNGLGYVEPGTSEIVLSADQDALVLVLGGTPFGEQIVMWWNFIGREHDEVAGYRAQWQHLIETGSDGRFSLPEDDPLPPLPAPALPNARMVRRG
jgi:redox-sensitive bicupin YhaK (pirin superfamily)